MKKWPTVKKGPTQTDPVNTGTTFNSKRNITNHFRWTPLCSDASSQRPLEPPILGSNAQDKTMISKTFCHILSSFTKVNAGTKGERGSVCVDASNTCVCHCHGRALPCVGLEHVGYDNNHGVGRNNYFLICSGRHIRPSDHPHGHWRSKLSSE
jgi:hypothetical protein